MAGVPHPTSLPSTVVLVHSPFLGPSSLRPLAAAVQAAGWPVELLDVRVTVSAPPVHARLAGAFADAMAESGLADRGEPVVLVGHSGAGPLLPAFAGEAELPVTGLVYLDAGLPTPGVSWRSVAPELYAQLRARSRDDLLPPWQDWFDRDTLVGLVPDPQRLAEFTEDVQRVPLAFLKEPRPTIDWTGPAGYLLLSDHYQEYAARADAAGWPVRRLDSHHLAPFTDPEPVAAALAEVLTELTSTPAPGPDPER